MNLDVQVTAIEEMSARERKGDPQSIRHPLHPADAYGVPIA